MSRRRSGRRRFGIDVRFWSLHSWSWDDRLADAAINARIDELTSWLLDALGPAPRVVDLGCGTGNHSWSLATSGAEVVGIDFAPGMLAKAAAKGGCGSASFVRADLREGLPVRPNTFDGAISVYSAQFFELASYAADVAAALRLDGVLVAELPRPGSARRVHRELSLRHRAFQRVNSAAAFVGERAGIVRVISTAEVDAALVGAGFAVVAYRDTDRSIAVLARRTTSGRDG